VETMLVRLKAYDPRRGHLLRRFTTRGIKFEGQRGWYRVEKDLADYLRMVRQVDTNPHSPLAFDVATEAEAERMDVEETVQARPARATDDLPLSVPRPAPGVVTTGDLPDAATTSGVPEGHGLGRRGRKAQE
jgi:hypothetical protein